MNLNENCLLEELQNSKPQLFKIIIELLNKDECWKIIILSLSQYRLRIQFSEQKRHHIENSQSPANELLNELIIRMCTIEHLKDILKLCDLKNILAILSEPEELEIIQQPGTENEQIYLIADDDLQLECKAIGNPPPKYQWHFNNIPVADQISSCLYIPLFGPENEGDYYCVVSHSIGLQLHEITSNTVTIKLVACLPEFTQYPPANISREEGANVTINVEIDCRTEYTIQWLFNNTILSGQNTKTLVLENLTPNDSGEYRCSVTNESGEVFSRPSLLTVVEKSPKNTPPSGKVALLIANEKYQNYKDLTTPVNDILLLYEKLTELKFKVISLMNLTLIEMNNTIEWFFQLTPPGSYVFICFIGHGFMLSKNNFMMPVDCPDNENYRISDCVCDELLVMKAIKSKIKILVLMLDICLKVPKSDENPHIFDEKTPNYIYKPYGDCHVVRVFSTGSHQNAYENIKNENGIYVKHISKYLTKDQPIVLNFFAAHEDFSKLTKLQKPSFSADGGLDIKFTERATESIEFLANFDYVNKINAIHELNFTHIGFKGNLWIAPHRGKILNAIDLHFSTIFLKWAITVQVSPEVFEFSSKRQDSGYILTLYNLQKAKSDILITIILSESKTKEGKIIEEGKDSTVVDLGKPLFAIAQIWYEPVH